MTTADPSEDLLGKRLVLWIHRQLETRPEADRRFVFRRVCERLNSVQDPRRGEALAALEACARGLGADELSAANYDRWRATVPAGSSAPTVSSIRHRFGSWQKARATALGEAEPDPTARRLLPRRDRISDELCIEALRQFVASIGRDELPLQTTYGEWASGRPVEEQLPRSPLTLLRRFGSWDSALRAAGLVPPPMRRESRARVGRFTPADARRALVAARKELGDPLTRTRYDGWVFERDRQRAAGSGPGRPDPQANTIVNYWGGWRQALREVLGGDVVLARASGREEYNHAELVAAWRACADAVGAPPSEKQYSAWRVTRMRHDDGSHSAPFAHTIARRVGSGSWSGVAEALGCELPRSRRSRREFSTTELADWFRRCADALGRCPSQSAYDQWRDAQLEADPPIHVPFSFTLARRLGAGAWSPVAVAAGVNAAPAPQALPVSDDEMKSALQACAAELGRRPTIAAYELWRGKRPLIGTLRAPHHNVITRRLGDNSWPRALATAGLVEKTHQ
jgi:Homing endonuclease associated repeat